MCDCRRHNMFHVWAEEADVPKICLLCYTQWKKVGILISFIYILQKNGKYVPVMRFGGAAEEAEFAAWSADPVNELGNEKADSVPQVNVSFPLFFLFERPLIIINVIETLGNHPLQ